MKYAEWVKKYNQKVKKRGEEMETKSRYEVVSELEQKRIELIRERDGLEDKLIFMQKELKEINRELEDKQDEINDFKSTIEKKRQTLNDLIKSVEDTLSKFAKMHVQK